MPTQEKLAEQFEEHRDHLRSVAYRMLGSMTEADDAVQEALATAGAHRHQRRGQPARLADDGGQPRVPGPPPVAEVASRGSARLPLPRPGRDPARRRPGGFGGAVRRGDPGAARGARRPQPARADGVRPARHVRRAVRRRSARSWTRPRRPRRSWPAARAAGSARPHPRRPTCPPSAASWTRSPRPPRRETSRRSWRSSIPTWSSAPTAARGVSRAIVRGAAEVASQASSFRRSGHEPEQTWVLVNGAVGLLSSREGHPIAVFCPVVRGSRIVEINILTDPDRIAALDLSTVL